MLLHDSLLRSYVASPLAGYWKEWNLVLDLFLFQCAVHQERASSVWRVSSVSRSDRMATIGMPRRHHR